MQRLVQTICREDTDDAEPIPAKKKVPPKPIPEPVVAETVVEKVPEIVIEKVPVAPPVDHHLSKVSHLGNISIR